MDCIFCSIIKGKIPCSKVYEDSDFIAFLDINPGNKGHCLVLPKRHYEDYCSMQDELLGRLAVAVKKVAKAVKAAMKADGYNLIMNNGRSAGQEVMHAHIHIIPRYDNDGKNLHIDTAKYEEGEMEGYREKIAFLI